MTGVDAVRHDPLVIAVLFPPAFDVGAFEARVGETARPLDVRQGSYRDEDATRLAKRARRPLDELRRLEPPLDAATMAALADAEVVLALDAPVDLVMLAPNLRWVQASGAGVNQFNEPALWERGIRLTTAAGVGAPPIAEFVMARLLGVWKRFRELEELQRGHEWRRLSSTHLVAGMTLGLVGLGAIGTEVARRAKAFDMRVIATRRHLRPGTTPTFVDEVLPHFQLPRLLAEADAVVLAVPDTPETRDLIGEAELAAMKPGALLCNVGRGTAIDEDALVAALRRGHLGAAVLDVARAEPIPPDSVLWDVENLYLSPHSSASSEGYDRRVAALFAGNVARYLSGESLLNEVDQATGY